MILKGSQRGGGRQLAVHLLNERENEHVRIHQMRGFVADDLPSAFHEAYAVSRGTRARQFLFSLSLNPPSTEKVSTDAFERAIDAVEKRLGLDKQPRAIVFHEKEGRRHAHAVWSRIDTDEMTAINLPFYKMRLRELSKELYIEHGWTMPRGLVDSRERDPANFSHAEWQQAKRAGHDPKALKEMFQECWAMSDSRKAFGQALASRGYMLARGDRRGHVAVDFRGEVYAVAKYVGLKTKEVRDKLGDPDALAGVEQVRRETADRMTDMLKQHIRAVDADLQTRQAALAFRKREAVLRQRQDRAALEKDHTARHLRETHERAQRFSKGLRRLWDRMTGKHAKVRVQNERETAQCFSRDRAEKDKLIFQQLDERRALHLHLKDARQHHAALVAELHRDVADFADVKATADNVREQPGAIKDRSSTDRLPRQRSRKGPGDRER